MSYGYTKLFGSIIHSTIWQAPDHVRLVWITLLAIVDRDGVAEASIPGLAKAAGVSIEHAENAISVLLAPDPYSRTPDFEGRRIAPTEGGWLLLNHDKYRNKLDKEEQRERTAERVARHRARKRANHVTPSNESNDPSREVRHTDTDQEGFAKFSSDQGSLFPSSSDPSSEPSGDRDRAREGKKKPAAHVPALERFHALYFAAYGTKPTWGAKQVAMLKTLVASHSANEAIRRMEILFANPPAWLKPPFDVGTLVQHFDKLAAASAGDRRGLSNEELLKLGDDMDREWGIDHDAG